MLIERSCVQPSAHVQVIQHQLWYMSGIPGSVQDFRKFSLTTCVDLSLYMGAFTVKYAFNFSPDNRMRNIS
jgi:hypothetical protein